MAPTAAELFAQIPDLKGKVAIVTGGNAGIGKVTCRVLTSKGAKVYMAARSKEKALEAIGQIKAETGKEDIHWLPLDLSDLSSIRDASENFLGQEKELHILINNAGIMATPYAETKDGFEMQFGTNVIGHFALIQKLLPVLLHTASISPPGTVRIINVSSEAHNMAPKGGIDFNDIGMKSYWFPEWRRYGQSKLGNILLTKEIVRRYSDKGIISIAIHPGVIKTQLHTNVNDSGFFNRNLLIFAKFQEISEDEGAYTQIFAATHPDVITNKMNGEYLKPMAQVGKSSCDSKNGALATKLWDFLEKQIANKNISD